MGSDDLKLRAKGVLSRTYWTSFGVLIVVGLFSGIFNITTSIIENNYGDLQTEALLSALAIAWILSCIFKTFVGNVLEVGGRRFFMLCRYGTADFGEVFSAFKAPHYMNIVKTLFLRDFYLFLWSLLTFIPLLIVLLQGSGNSNAVLVTTYLFSIPAIIAGYRYWMIPYTLAQNPDISTKRAFEISTQTMRGDKLSLFGLRLSFIGWYLLGAFTCGIGLLFLSPYVSATEAEFYYEMRKKAIGNGISTKEEMGYDAVYEMEINRPAFRQHEAVYIKTRPCPMCYNQISVEQKFCHFCGGNVIEKEEADKQALLEKCKQNGIGSLLKDEDIAKEAAMYRRIYGKTACLSYLKEKAKEMGFDDSEITEADIDNILTIQE